MAIAVAAIIASYERAATLRPAVRREAATPPNARRASYKAVRLLRGAELGAAYEDAFVEWADTGEATVWEATAGDGLAIDAAR